MREIEAKVTPNTDGTITVTARGLTFKVSTADDLFVLGEVMLSGVYSCSFPPETVVIDVGMNIGISSLFFASRSNVKHVYAFEPVETTYRDGLANFALNQLIAQKITPLNFGLAKAAATFDIAFSADARARTSLTPHVRGPNSQQRVTVETVSVRRASEALDGVLAAHPGNFVVLKIDCEGAEYEIFCDLSAGGIIQRLNVILAEWHEKGVDDLIRYLPSEEWVVYRPQPNSLATTGMLYAFRVRMSETQDPAN